MSVPVALRDVSFAHGDAPLLRGVNLSLEEGVVLAIVGPNGAGKSTLLKLLAGILVPSAGRLERAVPKAHVAYLAQSDELPDEWTVRELVELGRLPHQGLLGRSGPRDAEIVERAMDHTDTLVLSECSLGALSGGERQRAALARALAQEPRVLLLDEPTNHLDVRHQLEMLAVLRREANRGVAVAVVLHDLVLASHADRCAFVSKGRELRVGSPAEVLVPGTLRKGLGVESETFRAASGRPFAIPTAPSSTLARPEEDSK